jgi:hypothetical protein
MRFIICFFFILNSCRIETINDKDYGDLYQKEMLKEKKHDYYFIDYEYVESILKSQIRILKTDELRKNDNVCFFDIDGNIIYQAVVDSVDSKSNFIQLEYLNLKNGNKIYDTLTPSLIYRFCKRNYNKIEFYRPIAN